MKRFVGITGTVLALLAVSAMLTSTASAWTVRESKWKYDLDVAGDVYFTSSFSASDGETITITLHSTEFGHTIDRVTLKRSTPKRLGSIAPGAVSGDGMSIQVTVYSSGDKTLHLWLWLTSGEHVGVNVHF